MSFNTFMYLCNQNPNHDIEHFYYPGSSLVSCSTFPAPDATTVLTVLTIDFISPILDLHINGSYSNHLSCLTSFLQHNVSKIHLLHHV